MEIKETERCRKLHEKSWNSGIFRGDQTSDTIQKIQGIAGITYHHLSYNSCIEDNDAVISQVKQDKLTPRIKYKGILITQLHEQGLMGTYVTIFTPIGRNKSGMNIKPHGGANLQTMNMAIVGYQCYPLEGSEHYQLLQIDQYNIGLYRG